MSVPGGDAREIDPGRESFTLLSRAVPVDAALLTRGPTVGQNAHAPSDGVEDLQPHDPAGPRQHHQIEVDGESGKLSGNDLSWGKFRGRVEGDRISGQLDGKPLVLVRVR